MITEEEACSPFAKRVRDVRTEALAADEAAAERAVPTPPGMSLNDLRDAAPAVLAALERLVCESVREAPEDTSVIVMLARRPYPTCDEMGEESAWWSAICEWAITYAPAPDSVHQERYRSLVSACCAHVRDMWNTAHPEFPAQLDRVSRMLIIEIH